MDVGKNRKVQKSSLNGIFSLKKNTYIPAMHKKTKDSVSLNTSLNNDAKILNNELVKIKGEQGLIGNLWDGFKNLTKVGAGSQKVEKAIKDLNNGKLTNEEAQQILENYKDGQKTCVDVVADMISSIVSVGAFVAAVPSGGASLPVGLAISTALSTGLKVGIKGIDAKSNGREYNSKNLLYDVVTGSVNGLLAPVTNGFGSSLTKTIGCKLGLEITGDVLETGAKNTLKNLIVNQSIDVAGGTVKQRALALGAGMAIDGALGGAADNTVREIVEEKDNKNVFKAATEGFLGGLIMAPIIGGGFRIVSKFGSKIGDKISFKSNNVSDIPNNPFSQGLDRKPDVAQSPLINSDDNVLPKLNCIVQQTTDSNLHISRETNIIPSDELVYIEEVPSIPISRTIDVDDSVSQAAKVDEAGTKEIAASSVKSDSILDSEVKSGPEIKNVLTPEEIIRQATIKKLKDSLENIPTDVIKKKEFIKEFLLTNLKTGKQLEITPNSFSSSVTLSSTSSGVHMCSVLLINLVIAQTNGDTANWNIFNGKAITFANSLALSVAKIFGTISPQIKITTVIIIVAYVTASGISGNNLNANTVVIDDAKILTKLLPIKIVEILFE